MQVIFQAVKAANSVRPDDVAKALSGHEFDTILGKLTIRAKTINCWSRTISAWSRISAGCCVL